MGFTPTLQNSPGSAPGNKNNSSYQKCEVVENFPPLFLPVFYIISSVLCEKEPFLPGTEAVSAGQSSAQCPSIEGKSASAAPWVETGFYLVTARNTSLQTAASASHPLEPRRSANGGEPSTDPMKE